MHREPAITSEAAYRAAFIAAGRPWQVSGPDETPWGVDVPTFWEFNGVFFWTTYKGQNAHYLGGVVKVPGATGSTRTAVEYLATDGPVIGDSYATVTAYWLRCGAIVAGSSAILPRYLPPGVTIQDTGPTYDVWVIPREHCPCVPPS